MDLYHLTQYQTHNRLLISIVPWVRIHINMSKTLVETEEPQWDYLDESGEVLGPCMIRHLFAIFRERRCAKQESKLPPTSPPLPTPHPMTHPCIISSWDWLKPLTMVKYYSTIKLRYMAHLTLRKGNYPGKTQPTWWALERTGLFLKRLVVWEGFNAREIPYWWPWGYRGPHGQKYGWLLGAENGPCLTARKKKKTPQSHNHKELSSANNLNVFVSGSCPRTTT